MSAQRTTLPIASPAPPTPVDSVNPTSGQVGSGAGGPSSQASASGEGTSSAVADRVQRVLGLIRPAVQSDGGDLELVEVTPAGVVRIRLHGACVGCPSSSITLKAGIERNLRQHVPEVRSVEAVD